MPAVFSTGYRMNASVHQLAARFARRSGDEVRVAIQALVFAPPFLRSATPQILRSSKSCGAQMPCDNHTPHVAASV
jgi:hypothetical protein